DRAQHSHWPGRCERLSPRGAGHAGDLAMDRGGGLWAADGGMVGVPSWDDRAQVQKDHPGGLRPVLYVLVGIQSSGKSTWARANAGSLQAEVVASDEIRNELEAEGLEATHEGDRVFAIFEARVARLLDAGHSVIADATHARRAW